TFQPERPEVGTVDRLKAHDHLAEGESFVLGAAVEHWDYTAPCCDDAVPVTAVVYCVNTT
ncbi:MAG: hypothetical protein ACOVOX_09225, partial [Burkholderiaceae bacterium]